ncbi:MAG: HU family DNA-binding protein [Acidobacteriia bacterium]|nr:HU family DNA-binding protein [Terriglobia bacterium]
MEKPEIARRLAQESGVSAGEAADRLDRIVYQVLQKVNHGEEARWPGLGVFLRGADGRIRFEKTGSWQDE